MLSDQVEKMSQENKYNMIFTESEKIYNPLTLEVVKILRLLISFGTYSSDFGTQNAAEPEEF